MVRRQPGWMLGFADEL
jgi:transposase